MSNVSNKKIARAGAYVVRAGEARPTKVVARLSGKATQPTPSDRRAARTFLRLKKV